MTIEPKQAAEEIIAGKGNDGGTTQERLDRSGDYPLVRTGAEGGI